MNTMTKTFLSSVKLNICLNFTAANLKNELRYTCFELCQVNLHLGNLRDSKRQVSEFTHTS